MCKEEKMKLRSLIMLLVISFLVLSGCSPSTDPTDETITLKLAIQDAGYGVAHWEHIISTFEAEYPNVKVELTASPDIGTLISTMAQAGNDDEMFDLIQAYSPYAAEGLLEPLDDLLDMSLPDNESVLLKDSFLEGVDKMIVPEADGKIYKLPKAMWLGGLFYNKDVFTKYGWDTNPQTWSEFLDLMADIKADGLSPLTYAGIYNYLYFTVGWHKAFELAAEAGDTGFRNDFVNYADNRFNNEYMLGVYDKIYQLGQLEYFDSGVAVLDHTQSQMQVIQEKAALVSSADWIDNEMKSVYPETGFTWGYMSIPFAETAGSEIYVTAGASDSLSIWAGKSDTQKEWAKKFLLWTFTNDSQKVTAEAATALPATKTFYEDEANIANLVSAQKAIFDYINNNNVVIESNFAIKPANLDGELMQMANTEFETNIPLISLGQKTAAEVLNKANEYYQQALGR